MMKLLQYYWIFFYNRNGFFSSNHLYISRRFSVPFISFSFKKKKKISLKFNQNTPRLRLIRDNIKKENFLDGDYSKEYNPNCDLAQVRIFF